MTFDDDPVRILCKNPSIESFSDLFQKLSTLLRVISIPREVQHTLALEPHVAHMSTMVVYHH